MIFEVLGSRKRLEILRFLSGEMRCVSEIMSELKMDGKTAMHHLRVLERNGLVGCKKVGRKKLYYLRKSVKLEISPPPKRIFKLVISDAGVQESWCSDSE